MLVKTKFKNVIIIIENNQFIELLSNKFIFIFLNQELIKRLYRLLDSLMVECWLRVRKVPGSIPSQGPRHTEDVIKMVPVVPLCSTQH